MSKQTQRSARWVLAAVLAGLVPSLRSAAAAGAAERQAEEILRVAAVKGGLVAHVGCGGGELTAALAAGEGYVVHGLDTEAEHIEKAREHIRAAGRYGKVSASLWDGKALPYVDNLVNLLVWDRPGEAPSGEIMRVLAPGGVACIRQGGKWKRLTKPRPKGIDEWTHFLHGPDNNAVGADSVVGPPRHMQWLAGPGWTRHHHWDKGTRPGIRSLVAEGGRIYYLVDEATAATIKMPSRWFLAARDAFSGVLLWKRPLAGGVYPPRLEQLWRLLVAVDGRLYLPLGAGEPLSAVDAGTGKVLRTYKETAGVDEVIVAGGRIFAVTGGASIVALRADTGELLWRWAPADGAKIVPLTLAASDGRVFVKTDTSICCLSADGGKTTWRHVPKRSGKRKRLKWPRAKLIAKDGVVLCSYGGKDPQLLNRDEWMYLGSHPRVIAYAGRLAALSAADGKVLWETAYRPGLESYPGDIFVIGRAVWLGPDFSEARDLHTGKVVGGKQVLDRLWTTGHHHRCYPAKATSRYIFTAKRGVEMIDTAGENHSRNNWLRGTCRLGITPCNGLIYATPHSCGCYMEAKLFGFWAIAPQRKGPAGDGPAERLEKGPAYSEISNLKSQISEHDWPTYRRDGARSGISPAGVGSDLRPAWRAKLGGRLTQPVVAGARVVVAQTDSHRIVCLDAEDGKQAWSFTTGGRVDSPPTIHAGTVLGGCADGWVYCLGLGDGRLIWRFLAAPRRASAVAMGQVESLWPVHGGVLVAGGKAYAAAGRSSYLDGGMVIYALDPATGSVLRQTRLRSEHSGATSPPPNAKRTAMAEKISQNSVDYKTYLAPDRSDSFSMAGARSDVLVADAGSIFLRQIRFDAGLVRQQKPMPHLFSTTSLLDGDEIHRSHWVLGTGDFTRTPVAYSWIAFNPSRFNRKALSVPYGLMLVFDAAEAWGACRNHLLRWNRKVKGMYALFAAKRPGADEASLPDFRTPRAKEPVAYEWVTALGLRPRALIGAGKLLFVAGMPDTFDPKAPSAAANAAFEGRAEGVLHVVSRADGKTVGRLRLESPPVWDGMAAADGKLFLSTRDGKVTCFVGR